MHLLCPGKLQSDNARYFDWDVRQTQTGRWSVKVQNIINIMAVWSGQRFSKVDVSEERGQYSRAASPGISLRLSQDVCLSLAKSGPADTQPALVSWSRGVYQGDWPDDCLPHLSYTNINMLYHYNHHHHPPAFNQNTYHTLISSVCSNLQTFTRCWSCQGEPGRARWEREEWREAQAWLHWLFVVSLELRLQLRPHCSHCSVTALSQTTLWSIIQYHYNIILYYYKLGII